MFFQLWRPFIFVQPHGKCRRDIECLFRFYMGWWVSFPMLPSVFHEVVGVLQDIHSLLQMRFPDFICKILVVSHDNQPCIHISLSIWRFSKGKYKKRTAVDVRLQISRSLDRSHLMMSWTIDNQISYSIINLISSWFEQSIIIQVCISFKMWRSLQEWTWFTLKDVFTCI